MMIRYANDLPKELVGMIESHKHLMTKLDYLKGPYRSELVRFTKAAGVSTNWNLSSKKGTKVIPRLADALKDAVLQGSDNVSLEPVDKNSYSVKDAVDMLAKTEVDDFDLMLGYLVTFLAVTHIEEQVNLVISLIWSEQGGLLFIDNFRQGVDTLGYMSHPYLRAGWDAELTDLIPHGSHYEDKGAIEWMRQFHDYIRSQQMWYSLNYAEADNTWWVSTSSCAPDEEFMSKNRMSVCSATEDCLRHLTTLGDAEKLSKNSYTILGGV